MVYDYPAYNLTQMANSSGIVELMQTVNSELMFNTFGIMILITIWLVSFMAFYSASGSNAPKALAGASVISFGISMMLIILDMRPEYGVYLLLISSAFFVAMLVFTKQ